jgi:hypothetical protein
MAGNRYVPTIFTATDDNGDPIPGAKLYFYENETTTPKNSWSDIDLTATNAWPVVADGAGRFTTDIFLDTDPYRIKLTDENGVQIWLKDDCNTFNGPASASDFPFPGAVVEFYGTQDQLNTALASFWYIFDGNNGLPNYDNKYPKTCIDVASIGTTGGSNVPTGTVGGTAISIAQLPSHDHLNGVGTQNSESGLFIYATSTTGVPGSATRRASTSNNAPDIQGKTSTTGSGATHDHSLTMNTFDLPYYQLVKLVYLGY